MHLVLSYVVIFEAIYITVTVTVTFISMRDCIDTFCLSLLLVLAAVRFFCFDHGKRRV